MLGESWALGALRNDAKDCLMNFGRAHLELSVPGLGPGPGQDDIGNPGSGGRYGL